MRKWDGLFELEKVMLAEGGMIDISDDTNLTAGTGINIIGDTVAVQDIYVLNAGDTMTGTLDMAFADPTIQFAAPGADSDFWIDEYGLMIPIVTSIFAVYFWRKASKEGL